MAQIEKFKPKKTKIHLIELNKHGESAQRYISISTHQHAHLLRQHKPLTTPNLTRQPPDKSHSYEQKHNTLAQMPTWLSRSFHPY